MTAKEQALQVLGGVAEKSVVLRAKALEKQGAEWGYDPQNEGVVGLLKPGTNRAYVVVYVNLLDFECDGEEFWP